MNETMQMTAEIERIVKAFRKVGRAIQEEHKGYKGVRYNEYTLPYGDDFKEKCITYLMNDIFRAELRINNGGDGSEVYKRYELITTTLYGCVLEANCKSATKTLDRFIKAVEEAKNTAENTTE